MKRKYLSLVTAVASLVAVALFVVLGALFAVRLANGENFIPKVEGDLWIVEVINRVNKAGFSVFFTIASIVLVGILAIYRITMAYFYFKVFNGDGEFYKARKGEIIFFSLLSLIIAGAGAWVMAQGEDFLPPEISLVISVLTIVYGVLFILPIVELVISVLCGRTVEGRKQTVPTRDGIMGELDAMADQAAAVIIDEKDERELLGIIVKEDSQEDNLGGEAKEDLADEEIAMAEEAKQEQFVANGEIDEEENEEKSFDELKEGVIDCDEGEACEEEKPLGDGKGDEE